MRFASSAVLIHEGRIDEIGPPGKVFASPNTPDPTKIQRLIVPIGAETPMPIDTRPISAPRLRFRPAA